MARKPQANKIKVAAAEAKYVGSEPVWTEQPAEEIRKGALVSALNWYNYACDKKQGKEMLLEYLKEQGKTSDYKVIKGVSDASLNLTTAWLARMSTQGLELNADEAERISIEVERHKETKVVAVTEDTEEKPKGPTIQDRMLEKANEAAGELEGILDNFIVNGCKPVKGEDAISVLKVANILPQHISVITDIWEAKLAEFQAAHNSDEEISEYYAGYGKIELRNLVKFAEQVIADALSYVQYKKVARTPRRKKPVPPEKVVAKLKYQKEFGDIKSEKPTKILGAKEMFVYNTKNRKLQYYVADQHSGGLYVKNNAIIGYDPTQSVMKTLRKPEEQVKELMKASKPNSRKFFSDIKAVESKLNGRFAETLVILKVH
jgi:hypothetical protein